MWRWGRSSAVGPSTAVVMQVAAHQRAQRTSAVAVEHYGAAERYVSAIRSICFLAFVLQLHEERGGAAKGGE